MARFIWQDWLMVLSFFFNQGARVITIAVTTSLNAITSSANNIEMNPVARLLQNIQFGQIIVLILVTALIATAYILNRKKMLKDPSNEHVSMAFNLFVFIVFFATLIDFLGDIGVWVGILIH